MLGKAQIARGARGLGPLAMALAAIVVLAGCGGDPVGETAAAGSSSTAATPSSAPSSTMPSPPAPAPAPSESMILPPGADAAPAEDGPLEAAPLPTTEAAFGEPVAFDTGVTVELASLEAIEVDAATPGETSGPALVVNVVARNGSGERLSVDSAVVVVSTSDGQTGVGTTAGAPEPLSGILEPGATATGRYVFMLDPAVGREITVSVNYAAGEPVAVFTGTTL